MKAKNLLRLNNINTLKVPKFIIINDINNTEKIEELDDILYSVRSSCEAEDNIDKSFAGAFKTFLNVDKKHLKEKIKEVFNSLNEYNGRVIVQEMVQSDYSGVIFTSNPIGILNEIVITIGKGLGDNIVEDKIDTTTYYYNNDDELYYYDGENIINEDRLSKLVNIANIIKKEYQIPMDIEFAIKNDEIYILQARPITTFEKNYSSIILDNSNIIESYPGISLHLTQDFVKEIYYKVFRSLIRRLTKDERFVQSMDKDLQHMIRCCNNKVYYDITNWYKVLNLLPFSNKIISIWQDMLGVNNRYVGNLEKISISTKFKVIKSFINLVLTCPKKMKTLNNNFDSLYIKYRTKLNNVSDIQELLDTYDNIMTELTDVWDITLVNDMYTFLFTAIAGKNKKELISGIKNIESMKPVLELNKLAKLHKSHGEDDLFIDEMNKYIEMFGDRCLEELKLETKTYRTNPDILLNYIKTLDINTEQLNENNENIIKENFFIKRAKLGVYNRETSRMNRSRIFGIARDIMLKIGENLKKQGFIEDKADIFYIHIDEIRSNKFNEFKQIINDRKQEIKDSKQIPNYSRLEFSDRVINKRVESSYTRDTNKELVGVASSNGKVTGEIVVIDKVDIKIDVKDKIIVTESTDPGWVFLIQNCKGVIAERGSILSHTAIVTRELKKPSVVNVKGATKKLKTGDTVEINGYTGKIKIISRG